MTRRDLLRTLAAAPLAAHAQSRSNRPNIVLIMADDMGFSDIGCYGGEIHTPNLDALASKGVRFTQFYNNARCCPTRASLLTGLYSHQAGIGHMVVDWNRPGYRGDLNKECVTIAEALKPAGYHTLMAGKWHVTHDAPNAQQDKHNWPLQRGFEKYFGTIIGAGSYYDPAQLTRDNERIEAPRNQPFYYTDAIGDAASSYISEYAKKPDPFFLYCAFTSPHWPLHALEEDIAVYKDTYKIGWDELRARRHKRQLELGIVDPKWKLSERDSTVPAWSDAPNKDWEARRMATYAAQIHRMDINIGKIVAQLKATGAFDNTLILFLADNGGCAEILNANAQQPYIPKQTRDGRPLRKGNSPTIDPGPEDTYMSYGVGWANASNTPFRLYKHWVHEGGISTPLIAHWPKGIAKPGRLDHSPNHIIDIMATCVDAAKAKYPGSPIQPMEGESLLPILQAKKQQRKNPIYWEHEGNKAMRAGNWKLVARFDQPWELYNISQDRTELDNLASDQKDRLTQMTQSWQSWSTRARVEPWESLPGGQRK